MAETFAIPGGGHDLFPVHPHGNGTDGMAVSYGVVVEGAASLCGGADTATPARNSGASAVTST
jgi:hypothetical protein